MAFLAASRTVPSVERKGSPLRSHSASNFPEQEARISSVLFLISAALVSEE